ncbi:hypothetical protein ACFQ0R_04410 [Psychroflexus salinarum]|uniref:Restriction endonuclease n=1 Tax=Psychroflexus salinarum TaxID=546024 RepID=A0ABW3GPC3_9FLAO
MTKEILKQASDDLIKLFSRALKGKELKITFNWGVSEKTVSEIGGRLIEDFILASLPTELEIELEPFSGTFINCNIPKSQRAMEDIGFTWLAPDGNTSIELLIDVKGHNETKTGSRPNLASIRKCKEFYSRPENEELWIFYCRYTPTVEKESTDTNISYKIEDGSFTDKGMFLLKSLSDRNMDPANIGSGGQILFARENNITLIDRDRKGMLDFLDSLSDHLGKLKEAKKKKK